jgi:SNF2 family DNA or RNA helicase
MAASKFQRIILDEGHAIKNRSTRWFRLMSIAAEAHSRWILSATPIQNSPGEWKTLCSWLRVVCPMSRLSEVGEIIMLRRTMDELREVDDALPPAPIYYQHDLTIPPSSPEGKLFRALCDQLQDALESRAVKGMIKLVLYQRILQFLVHPQLYIDAMRRALGRGIYARPDWSEESGSTKFGACCIELQKSVEDHVGTIVFCKYRAEIDFVADAAEAMGARVFSVRGGMSAAAVSTAIAEGKTLCEAGESVVFIVQIECGGCGLNLQFCKKVLFLSQHWNPAIVHQAVGRAVRIGQETAVEVHLFRVVDDVLDNIDRRMVQLHLKKIAGAQEVCSTLFEGFAPLREIPPYTGGSVPTSAPSAASAASAASTEEDPMEFIVPATAPTSVYVPVSSSSSSSSGTSFSGSFCGSGSFSGVEDPD